jgi:hypothetical protein
VTDCYRDSDDVFMKIKVTFLASDEPKKAAGVIRRLKVAALLAGG